MPPFKARVEEAAAFIRHRCPLQPVAGLLTGTGLGDCVAAMEDACALGYDEIPHFPHATVESHRGHLLIGHLSGRPLAAFQGRFHLYEGYPPPKKSPFRCVSCKASGLVSYWLPMPPAGSTPANGPAISC